MEPRTALVLTLALVACAHGPSPGGANDPGGNEATEPRSVEENLRRIADLQVFEVGELVIDVPDEATNCYGPCPGWEDEIEAATADAAERLQAFADAAEAAAYATAGEWDEQSVADDLATLSSLEIVQVGAFLEEQPANNPMCYNLPCQEDIDAAEEANAAKAARLDAIVAATKDL